MRDNQTAGVASLSRVEIVKLYEQYSTETLTYLDYCYRYLSFYITLLSAILTATIAGLLQYESFEATDLILLAGPILIIVLALLGYKNVKVFYRRFIETRVTTYNLAKILGFRGEFKVSGIGAPPFPSKINQGPIAEVERREVKHLLDKAHRENWDAERLVDERAKQGDTLEFARYTFSAFALGATVVAVFIVVNALM